MKQPSLAIFANFFIDNEERLQRMKDSFNSFKEAEPNQWVINIRGSLKYEAGNFLKEKLREKLNLFYLQSGRGWFYDSNSIASKIDSNYVLFWVEDHILINSPNNLNNCIAEMNKFNVDQLLYSFLISDIKKKFAIIEPYKSGEYIKVLKLDSEICLKTRKLFGEFYTVSCPTIMSKNFFTKILLSRKPYLKRWPRNVPFDFEKLSKDNIAKVIWHAIPNQELFAVIDDNHGQPGYSLISRGLYPNRISRDSLKNLEFNYSSEKRQKLKNIVPKKISFFIFLLFRFVRSIFYTLNLFWNK